MLPLVLAVHHGCDYEHRASKWGPDVLPRNFQGTWKVCFWFVHVLYTRAEQHPVFHTVEAFPNSAQVYGITGLFKYNVGGVGGSRQSNICGLYYTVSGHKVAAPSLLMQQKCDWATKKKKKIKTKKKRFNTFILYLDKRDTFTTPEYWKKLNVYSTYIY